MPHVNVTGGQHSDWLCWRVKEQERDSDHRPLLCLETGSCLQLVSIADWGSWENCQLLWIVSGDMATHQVGLLAAWQEIIWLGSYHGSEEHWGA